MFFSYSVSSSLQIVYKSVFSALTDVIYAQGHFALHYTKSLYIKKPLMSSNSQNFFIGETIFCLFDNLF